MQDDEEINEEILERRQTTYYVATVPRAEGKEEWESRRLYVDVEFFYYIVDKELLKQLPSSAKYYESCDNVREMTLAEIRGIFGIN